MGENKVRAEVIPKKILEEVEMRKKWAAAGIIFVACQKRQWGSGLADSLLHDTVDAEIIAPKELPPAHIEP